MKTKLDAQVNKRNLIYFLCISIITVVLMCARLGTGLEYRTDKYDPTDYVQFKEAKAYTQHLSVSDGKLRGLALQFGTMKKINKGKIIVKLAEDGNVIREKTYNAEYLVDNEYQEIYFDSPVNLNTTKDYTIEVAQEDNGETNAVALWISSGGNGLFKADKQIENSTMCYQLIMIDSSLRTKMTPLFIVFAVIILLILAMGSDFNSMNIFKTLIVAVTILVGFEMVMVDLFQNVNTKVDVVSYTETKQDYAIAPGETWENVYDDAVSEFSDFEIFFADNSTYKLFYNNDGKSANSTGIKIKLVCLDNGVSYVDRMVAMDEIVYDENAKQTAIKIACDRDNPDLKEFPKGKYSISVSNEYKNGNLTMSLVENNWGKKNANISLILRSKMGLYMACLLLMFISIYICIMCVLAADGRFTSRRFFMVSIIPLSVMYLVLILPWSAPDTNAHYLAAYRLSNLILGKKAWSGRACDVEFYRNIWNLENPRMRDYALVFKNFSWKASNTNLVNWPSPEHKMEYYSILSYLPQALGLAFARILGLGTVPSLYMARIFMLIVYIISAYNAVRKTPIGRFVFAAVALFPMSLMMSGSISYDPLVLIYTLNFLALTFRLCCSKRSVRSLVECSVWAFLVGAAKGGGYLIMLPLLLMLIDKKKLRSLRNAGIPILSGLISILIFDLLIPVGAQLFQFGKAASGKFSASYALDNPLTYLDMLIKTYLNSIDTLTIGMGGNKLAWLEETVPSIIVIALILIAVVYSIYEKDQLELKRKDKVFIGIVLVLVFFATPAMLLSWTKVGSQTVEGLQGRYYLPVLPLIIMLFTKFELHTDMNGTSIKHLVSIKSICFKTFALLSCISVYYMMRLYLTR